MPEKISDKIREAVAEVAEEFKARCWELEPEFFCDALERRLADAETHWLANVFQKRFPVPGIFKENLFNAACREIVAEWVPSEVTILAWWGKYPSNTYNGQVSKILSMIRNGEKFT
jgi:hypothetical protein